MLSSLPREVTGLILSYCNYATAVALIMTCKTLSYHPKPLQYEMLDLLDIELWPRYHRAGTAEGFLKQPLWDRDYFACCYCLRLRSAAHFTNAMMRGKRGKLSPTTTSISATRLGRFCIDCGIGNGRYARGVAFEFGGARLSLYREDIGGGLDFVCRSCGCFARVPQDQAVSIGICRLCTRTDTA